MKLRRTLVLLAILGCAGIANAADQSVLGKTLSVKDPAQGADNTKRIVLAQGKESGSASMIVGDPTIVGPTGGAIVEAYLYGTTGSSQAFELPQGTSPSSGEPYWTAIGTTGFKYADPAGEQGPVTLASIKRTPSGIVSVKVKIMGKRGPVSVFPPNSGTEGCVALQLGMDTGAGDRYSLQFGTDSTITNVGKKVFLAKNPQLEGVCESHFPCLVGNGGCDPLTGCTADNDGLPVCGTCPSGYTGSGNTSCNDINECATSNGGCAVEAACANQPGSKNCTCNSGYAGDGTSCNDINECAVSNGGCAVQAVCANQIGSRSCTCNSGYTGPGTVCNDINECATSNGGCAVEAACANQPGSRDCTCNSGYAGDGTSCNDINECAVSNGGCAVQAVCANQIGSRSCTCNSGYTGPGTVCNDINECATSNGGCAVEAACANQPGTRFCTCNVGYTGPGTVCNDINECATNNGGCSVGTLCTNTGGGFNCN